MYIVKIDDGFVEWSFKLEGSEEYSIQDLVNAICENTKLRETRAEVLRFCLDEDDEEE